MSSDNAVCFSCVSFSYSGQAVLENVNLRIKKGDFVTIVGPNGGGKSTLLKLILGLEKPDTGVVEIFGERPERSRLKIGYMPQYGLFDSQFPVSVMDVVLMGRLGSGFGGRYTVRDRELAVSSLYEVGLDGFGGRLFSELSGGQKQRVLIARALTCDPSLLILDEPTASVDPGVGESILHLLEDLNSRMTILMVTHDMGFVSKVVKSVICVNRVVVVHPTSDIDGVMINEIYGGDFRMIRHDHRCSEGGHEFD